MQRLLIQLGPICPKQTLKKRQNSVIAGSIGGLKPKVKGYV